MENIFAISIIIIDDVHGLGLCLIARNKVNLIIAKLHYVISIRSKPYKWSRKTRIRIDEIIIIYVFPISGESETLQLPDHQRGDANYHQPSLPIPAQLLGAAHGDGYGPTSDRPLFSTRATTYRIKIGHNVTMPCEIINIGNYVMGQI